MDSFFTALFMGLVVSLLFTAIGVGYKILFKLQDIEKLITTISLDKIKSETTVWKTIFETWQKHLTKQQDTLRQHFEDLKGEEDTSEDETKDEPTKVGFNLFYFIPEGPVWNLYGTYPNFLDAGFKGQELNSPNIVVSSDCLYYFVEAQRKRTYYKGEILDMNNPNHIPQIFTDAEECQRSLIFVSDSEETKVEE